MYFIPWVNGKPKGQKAEREKRQSEEAEDTARNDDVQYLDNPGQGERFIARLLTSTHEMRVVDALRVNFHVFGILRQALADYLIPLRAVPNVMGVDEKLAIALQWFGHGLCSKAQGEMYQRSVASVQRARHQVMAGIMMFLYAKYVKLIQRHVHAPSKQ